MTLKRFVQSLELYFLHGKRRRQFMNRLFMGCGQNVSYFPRMLPLYPELIRFHNNIVVGSNVSFITHDAIHLVLPTDSPGGVYPYGKSRVYRNYGQCVYRSRQYGFVRGENRQ